MLLVSCLSHQLGHARLRLRHLHNLVLLLGYIRVQVVGHLRIQDWLLVSNIHHVAKLVLNCFKLTHLCNLNLFHLFMLEELLAFLQDIFSHRHGLFKVLITVLQYLLESLLIHANHLLLIFKHLASLRLLLARPVWLGRHLHVRQRGWGRWLELRHRWHHTWELWILALVLGIAIKRAL